VFSYSDVVFDAFADMLTSIKCSQELPPNISNLPTYLDMDGWKMNFLLGWPFFQGLCFVSFGERCSIFFDMTSANPCKCWFPVVLLVEREWDGWICFGCGSRSVMLPCSCHHPLCILSFYSFNFPMLLTCQDQLHPPCFWCSLNFQVPAFQLKAIVFLHSALSFGYIQW